MSERETRLGIPTSQEEMRKLRKANKEFDGMVGEITQRIEQQIEEKNSNRSFRPKNSKDYRIHMKVKAVPITKDEKRCLLRYLSEKYSAEVAGWYFSLKKCWFSEEYLIKSTNTP